MFSLVDRNSFKNVTKKVIRAVEVSIRFIVVSRAVTSHGFDSNYLSGNEARFGGKF